MKWLALAISVGVSACGGLGGLPGRIDAWLPADAGVPDAEGDRDGASEPDVGDEAPPGQVFQILDPIEDRPGAGFICPVGLCSWFGAPIGKGERGGAIPVSGLPAPTPPRANSQHAWQVRLEPGGQAWDLHLDIHGPTFPVVPYPDLSAYAGIAFWARSDLPGTELTLAIEDDHVLAYGYAEALESGRPWFTQRVRFGAAWRRYVFLFDDFRQGRVDGSPSDARVHTAAFWSLHFLNGLDGQAVDYQFDDLTLLCRGRCPTPPFDVPFMPEPEALDDSSLTWMSAAGGGSDGTCAEIASLTMAPPAAWPTGPQERNVLRARIKGASVAEVPLWKWVVEKMPSGEELAVTSLDERGSLVALPIVGPGEYRIRAHTHYPTTETCGSDLVVHIGTAAASSP